MDTYRLVSSIDHHTRCRVHPQAAKVVCSVKISVPGDDGNPAATVYQANCSPSDSSAICVTGDKIIKFFRVVDSQFKPSTLNSKVEQKVYTAHCWLGDDQARVSRG